MNSKVIAVAVAICLFIGAVILMGQSGAAAYLAFVAACTILFAVIRHQSSRTVARGGFGQAGEELDGSAGG